MLFADGLELLAAIAVMRIGLSLEGSDVVGVDCGGALQSIRGGIMKRQLKLAGLAGLFRRPASSAPSQGKINNTGIPALFRPPAGVGPPGCHRFAVAVKGLRRQGGGPDRRSVV